MILSFFFIHFADVQSEFAQILKDKENQQNVNQKLIERLHSQKQKAQTNLTVCDKFTQTENMDMPKHQELCNSSTQTNTLDTILSVDSDLCGSPRDNLNTSLDCSFVSRTTADCSFGSGSTKLLSGTWGMKLMLQILSMPYQV